MVDSFREHLPALNKYFCGAPSIVRNLSTSSFLVEFNDSFFAVHAYECEFQILSVAHVLSEAFHRSKQIIGVPRVIASIPSASSWLLLTSYLHGQVLTSVDVASLLPSSLLFLDSFESITFLPSTSLISTFDYFYQFIASSLSAHDHFELFFSRLPLRPPIDQPCFVHGDFAPQNFLITQSLPRFSLVDWEYAGLGYMGFDRGWLLAASSFRGFFNPAPYLKTANDLYFLRFGYFRIAARLLKRRMAQSFISSLVGRSVDDEFVDPSLLRLRTLLMDFD